MENESNNDLGPDVAYESDKTTESVEESERNNRNEVEEEHKQITDVEEGKVGGESKIMDKSGEKEENPEKHNLAENCATPVLNEITSPTPGNGDTCPDPPPRPRRRSKVNTEEGETKMDIHEKTHNKEQSECYETKKDDMEMTKRDNLATTSDNKEKKIQAEETTHIRQRGGSVENKDKKTYNSISNKEANPVKEKNMKDTGKEEKCEDDDSRVGLKKELTLVNCVGIIVGTIIGTGIFVSPRGVLQYTGSVGLSLIVWALSGVMAIIGAICYVELGTMIPRSGGNYTYLFEAYGSLPAFISLWTTVVIGIPGSRAVAALTFANYVLQPFFPNDQAPPESALRIVGILLIVLLAYINSRAVRWATRVQDAMAMTKVLALIMIIVVGLFHLTRGTTDNFDHPMEGTLTNPALIATAFYHSLYAYDGWDMLNAVMEELKDPLKNMPRAVVISVTCVIVIYMLTNVAYFAVLPKDLMLASPAVAVTFGSLALGVVAWTIPIFVACSISGGLNGGTFAVSRLLYVSARNGHLPRVLSFVHVENNTPITSIVFLTFLSMCMFVTSDVRVLINYLAFSSNLLGLVCVSTFFWFRLKHPDLPRPIKVWIGFPIIYITLSVFLCVMPVVKQPLEVVAALVVLATGLPVYYFLVHKKEKPRRLVTAMDKVTYVCQLLFMAVPAEATS